MLSTWIEAAAKGRHGGPIRAGMWGAVVIGTHPVESNQEVFLELSADDQPLGTLPAFWLENKGVNSLWHAPIPPQPVGTRLRYRAVARHGAETAACSNQDAVVRPNLPDRTESPDPALLGAEGLVGNRMMTVRVDGRGSTYDIYYPTVGLHSDVRPAEGDQPQSRCHFRAIVGGLALGQRLDWFSERLNWDVFQHYQGATNLLVTELRWRMGPIRVLATDFVVMSPELLPRTVEGTDSPGQYVKRFLISNEGTTPRAATFGLYVLAEVNGGIGEPNLSWHDGDRTLLAANRGHGHANRKLARDATVEFALALDDRGPVQCEPTGPNEAMLLRPLELPAGGAVMVDLLVSGAFTGWRGDAGTFEYWLRPALAWFRAADLDRIERETAAHWDAFTEPMPTAQYPKAIYAVSLRRSALAAVLHADAKWGSVAGGFDRGLSAYCWPREALAVGEALGRAGHPEVARGVFDWLARVRGQNRPFAYWFQKYTIDGWPEWETPAIDQTALIPWALERHYRRTGALPWVAEHWPLIEQAATVCGGAAGHPGLRWREDLRLISSAGIWGSRFGAFLFSNACVVAGLRAACRLARLLDKPAELIGRWQDLADQVWEVGICSPAPPDGDGPGLVDPQAGRFLEARRLATRRGLWSEPPERLIDRSRAIDISLIGPTVPFGLLPATDPRVRRSAEVILQHGSHRREPNALTRWAPDPDDPAGHLPPGEVHRHDLSGLATLWMARYLIRLGQETGEGRHWHRALELLDAMLGRLCPLGVGLRAGTRRLDDPIAQAAHIQQGADLHAMFIEALLDLAGLEYDAPDRRLSLGPVLPPSWPHVGLSQPLPCGPVDYRLERPPGGTAHRLTLHARLDHPVTLQVALTCPGLGDLGPWHARPAGPPPAYDRATGRLSWSLELPAGETDGQWNWGVGDVDRRPET
jgi:glucoamylase